MAEQRKMHPHERALIVARTRCGLKLNRLLIEQLRDMIALGRPGSELIWRESGEKEFWRVEFKNRDLFVVYDPKKAFILTFLERQMASQRIAESKSARESRLRVATDAREAYTSSNPEGETPNAIAANHNNR
jgi:hypothetical protein